MKPYIPIYLDRVYRLRLTFAVISEYEQLNEKMLSSLSGIDTEDAICLLWLMMRQDCPALSLETTVKLIASAPDKTDVMASVWKAIDNSITKTAGDSGEPEFFDIENALTIAAEIGIAPRDSYDMTPVEFNTAVKAYIKKRKQSRNDLFTQAWFSAYFSRVKDMPDLDKYIVDIDASPKHEMSSEEMLEKVKILNAMYGGEVVEM